MLEIVNRPAFRIVLVGLVALGLQTTLLADLRWSGVAVQLLLAMSVAAGISGGSERGAIAGFALGLMFDLVLATPLGLTALVYGLAGFLAGYINSLTVSHPWWLSAVVASSTGALITFVHPTLATWVGVEGWLSTRLVKVAIVVAVTNALLAPLAVPVMRWCLAIKRQARLAPPPEIFA